MPLKSKAQARWMFANDPAMAERWAHETPGGIKNLPARVGKKKTAAKPKKGRKK